MLSLIILKLPNLFSFFPSLGAGHLPKLCGGLSPSTLKMKVLFSPWQPHRRAALGFEEPAGRPMRARPGSPWLREVTPEAAGTPSRTNPGVLPEQRRERKPASPVPKAREGAAGQLTLRRRE